MKRCLSTSNWNKKIIHRSNITLLLNHAVGMGVSRWRCSTEFGWIRWKKLTDVHQRCTTYRMNWGQTSIDGQWDGLSEQSAGDERSKHVIVDVRNTHPHLGDQPVRVLITDVIATGENWSRGLRSWDVPRVMWRWWWGWWWRVDENRQRL